MPVPGPFPHARQSATAPPRPSRRPGAAAGGDATDTWCNGGPRENNGGSRGRHVHAEPSPAACGTLARCDHNPGPGRDGSSGPLSLMPPASSPQTLAICRQESISSRNSRCPAWKRPSGSPPFRSPSAVAHHLVQCQNSLHNPSSATGFRPTAGHPRAWPLCQ